MPANASSSLPALPVPDLETTCHKYLASVKPLVSADDYAKTEQAVQAFLAADGPGHRLQARLHDRAARVNVQGTGSSWLEAWWNEYAYFANRVSNCFYVNFYFGLRDDPRHPKQLERAATLTKAALDFYALLANNQLSPDMARTTPLCMFQYRYLYNTCRYPDTPLDYTVHHDAPTNSHIAVVSRGQFYVFDTVTTTGHGTTRPLSREELLAQFEHVQQLARRSTAPGIGILTSESRDQWAATRGHLVAVDPRNSAHLQRLESARFLVCLEDHAPVTREEFSRACWHGQTGVNRFHDKCFQLVVFGNGKAGFVGEHSLSDGTTALRLCRFLLTEEEHYLVRVATAASSTASAAPQLPAVTPLTFTLDAPLLEAIQAARTTFAAQVAAHDIGVLEFDQFGKDGIKKLKCSPDAFVQMAIQLAYYRAHGRCRATYESTATKKFSHGRTETARSVSSASAAFVCAMADPAVPTKVRRQLCLEAVGVHAKTIAECANGQGIDRHLLGLKFCLEPTEAVPALFTDPSYAATSHWYLSTSQISDELIEEYGWGEVVPDGYGIAYMIKNHRLHFNIAALKTMQAKRLAGHVQLALLDMYEMLSGEALDRSLTLSSPLSVAGLSDEAATVVTLGESVLDHSRKGSWEMGPTTASLSCTPDSLGPLSDHDSDASQGSDDTTVPVDGTWSLKELRETLEPTEPIYRI